VISVCMYCGAVKGVGENFWSLASHGICGKCVEVGEKKREVACIQHLIKAAARMGVKLVEAVDGGGDGKITIKAGIHWCEYTKSD